MNFERPKRYLAGVTVGDYTNGVGAWIVAAFGSVVTSLFNSLRHEELLYGNAVALGTVLFIFYRMILLGADFVLRRKEENLKESVGGKVVELYEALSELADDREIEREKRKRRNQNCDCDSEDEPEK